MKSEKSIVPVKAFGIDVYIPHRFRGKRLILRGVLPRLSKIKNKDIELWVSDPYGRKFIESSITKTNRGNKLYIKLIFIMPYDMINITFFIDMYKQVKLKRDYINWKDFTLGICK